MWYDSRGLSGGYGYRPRLACSFDGGASFAPSIELGHGNIFDLKSSLRLRSRIRGGGNLLKDDLGGDLTAELGLHFFDLVGGDTNALIADEAGTFHGFWIDNTTGTSEIWTRAVHIDQSRVDQRYKEPPHAVDISASVTLQCSAILYDAGSREVGADCDILNTGRRPLRGPYVARLLGIDSTLPGVRITSIQPEVGSSTQLGDISHKLLPGMTEPIGTFKFSLNGLTENKLGRLLDANIGMASFVTMRVRIYSLARSAMPD